MPVGGTLSWREAQAIIPDNALRLRNDDIFVDDPHQSKNLAISGAGDLSPTMVESGKARGLLLVARKHSAARRVGIRFDIKTIFLMAF